MNKITLLLLLNFVYKFILAQSFLADTLYHEEFNNRIPLEWQSQSMSSPNHLWIWSNTAPGGQYSANAGALNSPSGSNGFLLLPSDLYNTPTPSGGFVNVNASITSSAIFINPKPSVHLSFYQSQRFYGDNANQLYVEVSADSVNWTVFSTTNKRTAEASSINGEYLKINVSSVLANQSTAYLRFVQSGASHYYWMIDDVMLMEGPMRQLELSRLRMTSSDTFQLNPISFVRPAFNTCPRFFEFDIENTGSTAIKNAYCVSKLYQDSSASGAPGSGLLGLDTVYLQNQINPGEQVTVNHTSTGYIGTAGVYTYLLDCKADSAFDLPAVDSVQYSNTNTILAKTKEDTFNTFIGAHQFIGGGNFRDFIGNLLTLVPGSDSLKSLSFFIPNEPSIIGAQIVPRVYHYDQDSSSLGGSLSTVVAESLAPATVSSSMLGKWVEFNFNLGTGPQYLAQGQYVAGVSFVGLGPNPTPFLIGRDIEAEKNQHQPQSLVFINDSLFGWKWISQVPAVRINFASNQLSNASCPTLVSNKENQEKTIHLTLFPNPTSGYVTLKSSNLINERILLSVVDLHGRVLFQEEILEQSSKEIRLDFNFLTNGLYFIQLRSDSYTSTENLVIQGK